MGQKKSEFVSAFDIAARNWKALANAVIDQGGTDEYLRRIETDEHLRQKLAKLIVGWAKATGRVFILKTGGNRTTEELVQAGRYDYANPDITSANFPVKSFLAGMARIEFLEFDRGVSSEEVLAEADCRGLARPIPEHCLLFGERYPEEQRERPIVFLHEPWLVSGFGPRVLSLWSSTGQRKLDLEFVGGQWYPNYRFAFLRPSTRA